MSRRFGDRPGFDQFVLYLISLFGWAVVIGTALALLTLFGLL